MIEHGNEYRRPTRAPRTRTMTCAVLVLVALAVPMRPLSAQSGDSSPPCEYTRCALGIAPVWNGLAVVRGAERVRVANLQFFLPGAIDAAFTGDSARACATRAVETRRLAATLTDVGGVLIAAVAVRGAAAGRLDAAGRALGLAGAGAFAVSVPLHFSADGWLSRAVWWHNATLVR